MQETKNLLRSYVELGRGTSFVFGSLALAAAATFRNFGYDLNGVGEVKASYPYVADGWGIWYWLAQVDLNFDLYFFVLTLLLSAGILLLAISGGKLNRPRHLSVAITITIYFSFWFLFAHSRYGTAVVMIALAVTVNNFWLLAAAISTGYFFHKAVAGGAFLIGIWLMLRNRKYGLIAGAVIACGIAAFLFHFSDWILLFTEYDSYQSWNSNAAANTPLKYYFDIAVLLAWKGCNRKAPNGALLLALLFLPTAYYNVFAGRAHEFYAAFLLSFLLTNPVPRPVRYAIVAEYLIDVGNLAFFSGVFF